MENVQHMRKEVTKETACLSVHYWLLIKCVDPSGLPKMSAAPYPQDPITPETTSHFDMKSLGCRPLQLSDAKGVGVEVEVDV